MTDAFLEAAVRESLVAMELRRIISKDISREGDGFSVRAAIDAVVAVNVNQPGVAEQARATGEQEVSEQNKEAPDE